MVPTANVVRRSWLRPFEQTEWRGTVQELPVCLHASAVVQVCLSIRTT